MQDNFEKNIARQDVYAGFFVRLAAYLIDTLLLSVCLFFPNLVVWATGLSSPDNFFTRELLFSFSLWDITKYLLMSCYFVLLTYFCGATLGKKVMRLQVVTKDGSRLTFINALYRETLGKYLSSIILYIGYILAGVDKEKRGLHDILCDTRVIYTCKVVEYRRVQNVYMPQPTFVPGQPSAPSQPSTPNQPGANYHVPPQYRPPVTPQFSQEPPKPPQTHGQNQVEAPSSAEKRPEENRSEEQ